MRQDCLGLILLAGLAASCQSASGPEPPSAYQAVAARLAGSWVLLERHAGPIPGVPSCAQDLTIEMPAPEVDPPETHGEGVLGKARVAFCGQWQDVDVISVSERHESLLGSKTESAGVLTVRPGDMEAVWTGSFYYCVLKPRLASTKPEVRWSLRWQPVRCETLDPSESPQVPKPRFRIVEQPLLTLLLDDGGEGLDAGAFVYGETLLYRRNE